MTRAESARVSAGQAIWSLSHHGWCRSEVATGLMTVVHQAVVQRATVI